MALAVMLVAVVGFDLAGCFERLPDASVNRGCGPVDVDSQGCPTAKFVKCALGANTNVNASSDCYEKGLLTGILGGGGGGGAGGASGGARLDLLRRSSPCPGDCQAELPLDPIFECGRKVTIARSPLKADETGGVAPIQERVFGLTKLDGYKRVRITARGVGQIIVQLRTGLGNPDAGKIQLDSCLGRLNTISASTASIELTDAFQSYDFQSGFGLEALFLTTQTGVAMELECVELFADCAP